MKKVSIIMPVYNAEDLLERAVKSVIDQTYQNIEILVVNDGSTDHSLEIINRLAKTDDRIKVIDKKNGGSSSARNAGIENATGEYLYFLDSDDYIEKDLLEKTIGKMEEKDLDMGWFNYVMENESGEVIRNSKFSDYKIDLKEDVNITDFLVYEYFMYHMGCEMWCRLYKHEVIRQHHLRVDERLSFAEDLEFNFRYLLCCQRIGCLSSESLYHYVRRDESLMGQMTKKILLDEQNYLIKCCYEFCEKQNYKEVLSEFYKIFLQIMGRYYDGIFGRDGLQIQTIYEETKKIEDKVFWDRMMKEIIKDYHIIEKIFPDKDAKIFKYYYEYLLDGNLLKLQIKTKIRLMSNKKQER